MVDYQGGEEAVVVPQHQQRELQGGEVTGREPWPWGYKRGTEAAGDGLSEDCGARVAKQGQGRESAGAGGTGCGRGDAGREVLQRAASWWRGAVPNRASRSEVHR